MDLLEKKNLYNNLFDFYGCLLTTKQQEYFMNYYFDDLSLAEIASIHEVSRNAIFDQLNKIYKILDEYEEKLQLYHKSLKRNELYEQYKNNNLELIEKLKELE